MNIYVMAHTLRYLRINPLYFLIFQMKNQATIVLQNKFWNALAFSGPFAAFVATYLIGLPILSLFRLSLVLWQSDRVIATAQLLQVFLQGLRVDFILLGLIILIPLLLSPLFMLLKAWRQ